MMARRNLLRDGEAALCQQVLARRAAVQALDWRCRWLRWRARQALR